MNKKCTINGCDKITRSGKCLYCEMHYYRNYLHGDPLKLKREQYTLNDNLFDGKWDDSKAWLLGMLWSDGYISDNSIGIKSKDIEIIENIKLITNTTQIIKKYYTNNKEYYGLSLASKKMSQALRKYGMHENKSLTIKYPNDLPKRFFGSFLRGIIDGDGHMSYTKHTHSKAFRMAVSFISGSPFLKDAISSIFNDLRITYNIFIRTKYRKNGKLETNWHGNDIYTITISARNSLNILYKLLYPNSNVLCLSRKRDIFTSWINTPQPKQGRPKIVNDNTKRFE